MTMNEIERRKYLALQAYYLEQKAAMERLQSKLVELAKGLIPLEENHLSNALDSIEEARLL